MKKESALRKLYIGDNLAVMRGLEDESADLIYLDPPFNSKRIYEGNLDPEMGKQSFKDIWTMSDINKDDIWALRTLSPLAHGLIEALAVSHGEAWRAYLTFMAVRLDEMRRLLKPAGSIYLHCDWRMSSPLRLLMDIIFGRDNFINEIIWCYKSGGAPKRGYARKHDTLLFYAKSESFLFNYEKEKSYGQAGGAHGGMVKYHKDENGVYSWAGAKDWWPISILAPTAKERTGWATQKPLALLERVIKMSSNKGGVVLDPFCGCGTACVAAEHLGRQWIGIDQHPAVGAIMEDRVKKDTKLAPEWGGVEIIDARRAGNLPRRKGVREINKNDPAVKKAFYDHQESKCAAKQWCLSGGGALPVELMDFDRIDPGKRGGYYTPENVQLLCRKCNAAKGGKTWTQFIREIKAQKARAIKEDPDVPRG